MSFNSAQDRAKACFGLDDDKYVYNFVALQLRDKMGWKGELIGGGTKEGYCFVFTGK